MPCLPSENRLMLCVRPGVFDAKASRFCCVSVLMQVDLPALDRPTKAISGWSCGGRNSSFGAVVRKRAVCIQAKALSAGPGTEAVVPGVAVIWQSVRDRVGGGGRHCRICRFCATEPTTRP